VWRQRGPRGPLGGMGRCAAATAPQTPRAPSALSPACVVAARPAAARRRGQGRSEALRPSDSCWSPYAWLATPHACTTAHSAPLDILRDLAVALREATGTGTRCSTNLFVRFSRAPWCRGAIALVGAIASPDARHPRGVAMLDAGGGGVRGAGQTLARGVGICRAVPPPPAPRALCVLTRRAGRRSIATF